MRSVPHSYWQFSRLRRSDPILQEEIATDGAQLQLGRPDGDSAKASEQAFAQQVREAKIAFMRRFYGIGDKYARNIWMDAYHPEFHDTIAIDQRIKKETEALGYSLTNYAEHDRFY